MSDIPYSPSQLPRRGPALGLWLVGVLGLCTFITGVVLVASAGHLPGAALPEHAGMVRGAQSAPMQASVEIPGFQRRGNTLVGEVTTRDGANLRLVFDAQTKKLIGLRTLAPPRETATEGAGQTR